MIKCFKILIYNLFIISVLKYKITDNHIGIILYSILIQFFQHCRFYPIIRVSMNNVLSFCMVQTILSGRTYASVCFMKDFYSFVLD